MIQAICNCTKEGYGGKRTQNGCSVHHSGYTTVWLDSATLTHVMKSSSLHLTTIKDSYISVQKQKSLPRGLTMHSVKVQTCKVMV